MARVFIHSAYDEGFQGQHLHMAGCLHALFVLRTLISVHQLCAAVAAFEAAAVLGSGRFFAVHGCC